MNLLEMLPKQPSSITEMKDTSGGDLAQSERAAKIQANAQFALGVRFGAPVPRVWADGASFAVFLLRRCSKPERAPDR